MDIENPITPGLDMDYDESISDDSKSFDPDFKDTQCFLSAESHSKIVVPNAKNPESSYLDINIIKLATEIDDHRDGELPIHSQDPNDKFYLGLHKRLIKLIHNYSVEQIDRSWIHIQKKEYNTLREQVRYYREKASRLRRNNSKLKLKIALLETKVGLPKKKIT